MSTELVHKQDSMWHYLKRYVKSAPHKAVYTDHSENDVITSRELAECVEQFAFQLEEKGIAQGDRCLIIIKQTREFPIAFLACSYLGAIPVPLNFPKSGKDIEKWEKIAADTQASCIISTPDKVSTIKKAAEGSEFFSKIPIYFRDTEMKDTPPASEGYSDIAFLQYTSGSTGSPKGVMVGNSCVTANVEAMCRQLDVNSESVIGMWLPYYHDMGLISGFLLPLYANARLVFMKPLDFMMSPIKWAEIICKYKVTHSPGPNFAFEMLAGKLEKEFEMGENNEKYSLDSLRCAFCGSEPVNLKTVIRFVNIAKKFRMDPMAMKAGYGLAENSLLAAGYVVADKNDKNTWVKVSRHKLSENILEVKAEGYISETEALPDDDPDGAYFVGSGHNIPEHKLTVRDDKGNIIDEKYRVGIVYIAGPSTALGYWNKEELTRQVFCTEEGIRTFNTGDLGFWGGNDEIFIAGRQKEMIIINGKNYYPSDMEHLIDGLDNAFEKNGCACFSFTDNDTEQLGTVVEVARRAVKAPHYEEWAGKIRRAVLKNCGIKIKTIVFLKNRSIERTTSGKLRRTHLKENCEGKKWRGLLYDSTVENVAVGGQFATLTDCRNAVRELLRGQSGIELASTEYDIPFAELGVSSVMCTAMSAELVSTAGINIEPQMFYTYNTINSLSKYIFELKNDKNETSQHECGDEELMRQLKAELGGI